MSRASAELHEFAKIRHGLPNERMYGASPSRHHFLSRRDSACARVFNNPRLDLRLVSPLPRRTERDLAKFAPIQRLVTVSSAPREGLMSSALRAHQMAPGGVIPHSSSTNEEFFVSSILRRSCKPVFPSNTTAKLRQHLFREGTRRQEGMKASGATQNLEAVTKGKDKGIHSRLDIADFHAFQAL